LPRDAAAELQLSAWQRRIDNAFHVSWAAPQLINGSDDSWTLRHQAALVWQTVSSVQMTLSSSTFSSSEASSTASSSTHISDGLLNMCRTISSHRRAADLRWSSLLHLRVYFSPSMLTAAQLVDELTRALICVHAEQSIAECDWTPPALTLSPVTRIHVDGVALQPALAVHALFLDLARLETQCWLAAVRSSDRVG
jgi:hypothetical protein